MAFVASRGRRIYYERSGQGPAVLFCHGAGSNAATWWQQLPAFAPHHTCLTMDIRCFGRSEAPLHEFTLENFVEDVLAILDQEKIGRVAFVGQSLGGFIGLKLALTRPERLAAFIACDSSLAIDHALLLDRIAQRQITHHAVTIEMRSLGRWFVENHPDKVALYAQINHFNPSFHSIDGAEWSGALAALLDRKRLIPLEALRQVACSTLLLVGAEDPIVPVSVMREVSEHVTGSEVVVVDAAGHSAYFEKPADFNRQVLDFIERRAVYGSPGTGHAGPPA